MANSIEVWYLVVIWSYRTRPHNLVISGRTYLYSLISGIIQPHELADHQGGSQAKGFNGQVGEIEEEEQGGKSYTEAREREWPIKKLNSDPTPTAFVEMEKIPLRFNLQASAT